LASDHKLLPKHVVTRPAGIHINVRSIALKGKPGMMASNIKLEMRGVGERVLRRIASTAWCPECTQIVELLTVKEASRVVGTNPATLLLWILKERIHCLDLGRLLICATSLQRGEAVTGDLDLRR
jgi:hypothetical protein